MRGASADAGRVQLFLWFSKRVRLANPPPIRHMFLFEKFGDLRYPGQTLPPSRLTVNETHAPDSDRLYTGRFHLASSRVVRRRVSIVAIWPASLRGLDFGTLDDA